MDYYLDPYAIRRDPRPSLRPRLEVQRSGSKVYAITPGATPADVLRAAEAILKDHGVKATITRTAPTWKPGDVVVVFYGPHRAPYTYVRGNAGWLVEKGREPKTDEWMTAELDAGRLKPVLQSGGEPFDGGRL